MGSRSCVYGGDVTVECVVYFCPNGDHGVEMREMRMWVLAIGEWLGRQRMIPD
jgi:hypothetical protein